MRTALAVLALALSTIAQAVESGGSIPDVSAPELLQPSRTFALKGLQGNVVYVDFWASWCVPCRLSFPWMNQLQQLYGPKGLAVVAVDVDRDRALGEEFLKQVPAAFRVVYDPSGHIARAYDFREMPTSVLIGRDGKPHFVHDGFFPDKEGEYLAHLNTLLADGGP